MNAVMLAHEILEMEDELIALRSENARLRRIEQEFREYVTAELHHHEIMIVGTLDVLLQKAAK